MKRFVLILSLCGLLAVPAIALARPFPPDSHYQGRMEGDPNTYFGFGTSGPKRDRKVRHLAVALPMNCYDGTRGIQEVWVHGHFDLLNLRYLFAGTSVVQVAAKRSPVLARVKAAVSKRGHRIPRAFRHLKFFFGEAEVSTDNGLGEAEVYGTVQRHGRAEGDLYMKTHSDETGKCYSGALGWRAHRGAHVDYPPAP
jgi:hypothetical protein